MPDRARTCAIAVGLLCLSGLAVAQDAPRADGEPHVAVLDTVGFWRLYHVLKPPVIQLADGLKPNLNNGWLDRETPLPPADWHAAAFDDSAWLRGPARANCRTPYVARLCLRGWFTVTDPAAVGGLTLSLGYHGGAIVRLNGREVARQHLAAGNLGDDALAEAYPEEAFLDPGGGLLYDWDYYKRKPTPEHTRRLALRDRSLQSVSIPTDCLRKGVNMLAIEIVRAPYDKAVDEHKTAKPGRRGCVYELAFNTCELLHVQLSAASPAGISQETVRPAGLEVWNSDPMAADFDLDFAGPSEPLYPVRIVAPRGGIVSGKAVVGSDRPIEGLRATLSALTGPDGAVIDAAAVRIRYGIPWSAEAGVWGAQHTYWDMHYTRYPRRPTVLGALADVPLEVFPVSKVPQSKQNDLQTPNQPEPVFGAVVPVWVTVAVPTDARPGTYTAELTVRAKDEQPKTVNIELKVVGWTLPERGARRTWVEMIQVPDTTALEYGLPLWSDDHWPMIARSFDFMGEAASRVVHLPLICNTNIGTEQSLVRWIRQTDGSWKHDFTLLERYLDTAMEHMGRPRLVVLYVWDVYQLQSDKIRATSSHDQERRALGNLRSAKAEIGHGPVVTTVDAVTGKVSPVSLPNFDAPESRALWQPVFATLGEILRKRGLAETAALGCMSDAWPNPAEARALKALSGDLPWVSYSHMGVPTWRLHDVADVCYQATVTQNGYANDDPPMGSHHGWAGTSWPGRRELSVAERLQEPHTFAENPRGGRGLTSESTASRSRHIGEFNITGNQRGIGRLGADFWHAVKDKYGNRRGRAADRFPQSMWRNQDLASSMLAPGPDGPVSTYRFEAFREGLQECEARIAIERALTDDAAKARLGADLVRRCDEALVERTQYMIKSLGNLRLTGPDHWYVTVGYTYWHRSPGPVGHQWFLGSGWQERSERLYTLAAEVEQALAGN